MSITLPVVDLSSAVVGTNGIMSLQASQLVAVPSRDKPILHIYNDSGAGLLILLKKSQLQFYLPAKGHVETFISNSEIDIFYQVQNLSTNIQVNQLWAVYFYPGEDASNFSALGTSTVTTQATTLVNTGNAFGTSIIFSEVAGDTSPTGSVNVTNDGTMSLGDAAHAGSLTVFSTTVATNAHVTPADFFTFNTNGSSLDLNGTGTTPNLSMTDSSSNNNIKLVSQVVTVTGSVSGTAKLYEILQGDVKKCIVNFNNYRSAAAQNLALPTAFTGFATILHMGGAPTQFLKVGVAQNIFILTTLLAAGGTGVTQTTINANSIGVIQTNFDTLSVNSGATAFTGTMILEGA